MAVIKRLSKEEIKRDFTHYATIHGVPIYYGEKDSMVAVRNWVPEFTLDVMEALYSLFISVTGIDGAMYMIKLGDKIK